MKVQKLSSRIIKYRLYDDEFHGWIYYTLDLDRYELSISGETTASYKWVETPKSESFIKLMVRCDRWYLLDKLFKKVFDIEASTKSIKEYIKEYYDYEDSDTLKKVFKDIDDMECNSREYFVNSVESILNSYYLPFDSYYIWDCCEEKFKHWDERAIDLFCEYIKPELKKELESEDTEWNHDATHCADYNRKICPKKCYRAELTEDLRHIHYFLPLSYAHYKGTKECPIQKKSEDTE